MTGKKHAEAAFEAFVKGTGWREEVLEEDLDYYPDERSYLIDRAVEAQGDGWAEAMQVLQDRGVSHTVRHYCCDNGETFDEVCPDCGCAGDEYCHLSTQLGPEHEDPVDWEHFNALAKDEFGDDAGIICGWDW